MQEEYKIENLIKIIIILILIAGLFYGLTIIIMNNQKEKVNNTTYDPEIKYDEILIGSIFNQKEEEYYVLAELTSDYLTLSSAVSNYSKKEDTLKIYIANLNDGFNKQYLGTESNFEKKYPIFSQSTLLKISNKKIVEYTEGIEEIQKKLG